MLRLVACFIAAVCVSAADRPNIVLILADDLGYSDVGFNGATFYETPNIDRLARQGMTFSNAYTGGPNCAPTRACLVTGTYTPRHKIFTPGGLAKGDPRKMKLKVPVRASDFKRRQLGDPWPPNIDSRTVLDPNFVSIAEVLKAAGYTTARLGKWHLGPDTQGFDVSSLGASDNGKPRYYDDPLAADRLTQAGIDFIGENRERPFFLYLPHWDVHTPLVAKEEVIARFTLKFERTKPARSYKPVFAAMIEAVDQSVGRITKALADLSLEDNTLVMFSSDNGGVGNITFNEPLRAGKGSLYEGGVRIATCARWPAATPAGSTCDTPITSVDFLPTLAELAGAKLPDSQPTDGASFVPLLKGERALENRPIYWHYPLYLSGSGRTDFTGTGWRTTPTSAIRQGDFKLIEFFEDGHIELYNLRQDVGEENDLTATLPDKARQLRANLKSWQRSVDAPIPSSPNPLYREKP